MNTIPNAGIRECELCHPTCAKCVDLTITGCTPTTWCVDPNAYYDNGLYNPTYTCLCLSTFYMELDWTC